MKRFLALLLAGVFLMSFSTGLAGQGGEAASATVLYQGHASLRITTPEGKVIYVDPYAGEGYDVPADLILITHGHSDHNAKYKIQSQNEGCEVISNIDALAGGGYKAFDLGYVTVETVQAGNNPNHSIKACVGFVLTLSDGKTLYISGDTSTTDQMAELAQRQLDYAFFCIDGSYNMGPEEASACAALVAARHSIPYHMAPGALFDADKAALFEAAGRMIVADGEAFAVE